MGCISTPIPNYLSTHLSLPLNHKTTQNSVEMSGVEQMRSMDEMARIKVEKGYMTTPMAWIKADKEK